MSNFFKVIVDASDKAKQMHQGFEFQERSFYVKTVAPAAVVMQAAICYIAFDENGFPVERNLSTTIENVTEDRGEMEVKWLDFDHFCYELSNLVIVGVKAAVEEEKQLLVSAIVKERGAITEGKGLFLNFSSGVTVAATERIRQAINASGITTCSITAIGSYYIGHKADDAGYRFKVDEYRNRDTGTIFADIYLVREVEGKTTIIL